MLITPSLIRVPALAVLAHCLTHSLIRVPALGVLAHCLTISLSLHCLILGSNSQSSLLVKLGDISFEQELGGYSTTN